MLRRLAAMAILPVAVLLSGGQPARAAAACGIEAPSEPVPQARPAPLDTAAWRARVAELDRELNSADLARVRLLFLGDSITQDWYPALFDQFYGERGALNLGVASDSTQSLLWRLSRIPLGSRLRPRLVVLLIGTNDLWPGVNPADVAVGIEAVVQQVRQRSPSSHVLVLGLLPRGATPDDPLRVEVRAVNEILSSCAGDMVSFADPGTMLVDGQGRLSTTVEYDLLHPTWIGYAILAGGLEPYIRELLGGNGRGE